MKYHRYHDRPISQNNTKRYTKYSLLSYSIWKVYSIKASYKTYKTLQTIWQKRSKTIFLTIIKKHPNINHQNIAEISHKHFTQYHTKCSAQQWFLTTKINKNVEVNTYLNTNSLS